MTHPTNPSAVTGKHTAGPWTTFTERGIIDIIGPNGWHIAGIEGDTDLDEANAHLISAAPDLLEACKVMCDKWFEHGESESEPFYIAARAAIRKAEGGGK